MEQVKNIGLVLIVEKCKASPYMGVLVNCWVRAQTPGRLFGRDQRCPYLTLYEVGGGRVVKLNVVAYRDSIAKIGLIGVLEQHLFPNSLELNLMLVTENVSHLGIYFRLSTGLDEGRPKSLFQLSSGLDVDFGPKSRWRIVELELVLAAIMDWADGRDSTEVCSHEFLLDWAGNKVTRTTVKEMLEKHTFPLRDHSMTEVSDITARVSNFKHFKSNLDKV